MLSFNLIGTLKGASVLCTRSTDDAHSPLTLIKERCNVTEFYTNGESLSYTQALRIVNEDEDSDVACTVVDGTVWSEHGPLMKTQDSRLRFLRFSQRDSILFSVFNEDNSRYLMEIQLNANKFATRTHSEMRFCHPIAADASGKYIWAITTNNEVMVHNALDKEDRTVALDSNYTAKSLLILNADSRSVVVLMEHNVTHAASIVTVSLNSSDLSVSNVETLGMPRMRMQPGSLVQGKGCMMVTLSNTEQQQLVTIASHGGKLYCSTHCVKINLLPKDEMQRIIFTDIVVQQNVLHVAVVVNRSNFSMWTFDMNSTGHKTTKLHCFPAEMHDLIIDRIVLMRPLQNKLEEKSSTTLVSAHVTDIINARSRQQLDIATSTARAMVDSSRVSADAAKQVAMMKEISTLREANEVSLKRHAAEHLKEIKELKATHSSKLLELEQRISELTLARDARYTSKQYTSVKEHVEKLKLDLREAEAKLAEERKVHEVALLRMTERVQSQTRTEQRLSAVMNERDVALSQLEAKQTAEAKRTEKLRSDHAFAIGTMNDQLKALQDENKRLKLRLDTTLEQKTAAEQQFLAAQQQSASELMLMSAQLAEARTRISDIKASDEVLQLKKQNEALQSRSRLQFESMLREVDSLRRANIVLSQSYQTLQSVSQFNFLPDGTSLETGVQMIRNLMVFQQDLAVSRDEVALLRKKVQQLEGGSS